MAPAGAPRSAGRPSRRRRRACALASRRAAHARAGDQRRRSPRVLERHPNALVFGEDVAVKGGVYGVTRGLHARFGAARVFDTLLDETSILGLALGAARERASCRSPRSSTSRTCTTPRTSCAARRRRCSSSRSGRYRNGMVVRIAGLRLPGGLRRALPQRRRGRRAPRHPRPRDRVAGAARRRRGDAARRAPSRRSVDGSVCVFLEPIALYHTRDLYEDGDEGWVAPLADEHVPHRLGADVRRRRRPDDRDLGERPAHVAARRAPARRGAGDPRAGARPALARAAAGRRHPARGDTRPAACSSSTRPAAPAGSPRAWSRRSWTPASTGGSRASRARTRSSRSATRRASCSSRRTRSRTAALGLVELEEWRDRGECGCFAVAPSCP